MRHLSSGLGEWHSGHGDNQQVSIYSVDNQVLLAHTLCCHYRGEAGAWGEGELRSGNDATAGLFRARFAVLTGRQLPGGSGKR